MTIAKRHLGYPLESYNCPFTKRLLHPDELEKVAREVRRKKFQETDILVKMKPSDLRQIKEMVKYALISNRLHHRTAVELYDLGNRLQYV